MNSNSDIASDTARKLRITVITQNVLFGTRTFEDNITIAPDNFHRMLSAGPELPMTSQASPGSFKDVYDELNQDADGIVSLHISSKISGTCNSYSGG